MAESKVVRVEVRTGTGRRNSKRLRRQGKVPAVIYGHGEATVSLSVPSDQISRLIVEGHRVVSLTGAASGNAFVRDVQWDTYGDSILHVDFTRVDAGELIETSVVLETRGEAPGTRMGGAVVQPLHALVIRCPPRSMTDRISVNINELELDQSITVGQLELPEGAKTDVDPETVVVTCVEKQPEVELEEEFGAVAGAAEPEVIKRKPEDGDEA